MLNFSIDNSELEKTIKDKYGTNTYSLIKDFVEFVQGRQIRDDIQISIEQIASGKTLEAAQVMETLRNKYE